MFARALKRNPALERERWSRRGSLPSGWRLVGALAWRLAMLGIYGVAAWWLSDPRRSPTEGHAVLLVATALQLVLLWLVLAARAAGAVTGEKERGTWEELLLTVLKPRQIIHAKFVVRLPDAINVLLLFSPVLLIGTLRAGVDWSTMAVVELIALGTALVWLCGGLCASAFSRRTWQALLKVYGLGAVFLGVTLAFALVGSLATRKIMWHLNPVCLTAYLLEAGVVAEPPREWLIGGVYFGACVLLSLLFLWLATRRIRKASAA